MYGAYPLGDLANVDPGDPDLSLLLADADGRLGHGWGAALLDGQILHLSSQPGGRARPRPITGLDGFVAALVEAELDPTPRTLAFELDFDLHAPVDDDLDLSGRADGGVLTTLSPSLADLSIVVFVGPGVARGSVDALRELAARGGFGVYNTWGAKGVFRWDSPFHFGTVGLQSRDLEFAGLDDVDLILTSGLDPAELGADPFAGRLVQDIVPWQLGAALADWPRAVRTVATRPALYGTISSIVTPSYEKDSGAVTPPRASLHLAGGAPDEGLVVSDAGTAGFWLARTFPTGVVGSIVVPAIRQPGFAAAAAIVCGLDGRPCIAVTDEVLDEMSRAALDLAVRLDVPVSIQMWGSGTTTPDEHLQLTRDGFAGAGRVDSVGLDMSGFEELVGALGPVVAWGADS